MFWKKKEFAGKIYDCFTFFNELELLELRLNELNNIVDYFVLVESTKTFTGKDKELYYDKNSWLFEKFKPKIIHIIVQDMPETSDPWTREYFQRNAILRGLGNCSPDDLILISDVDEIPNKNQIKGNISEKPMAFDQNCYFYFLNCLSNEEWYGTVMVKYRHLTSPQDLRNKKNKLRKIKSGGWHFSYLGGVEKIKAKIESFAHSEFNTEKYKNEEKLLQHLREGSDLFDRQGIRYKFVDIDKSYPDYLLENINKFSALICKQT